METRYEQIYKHSRENYDGMLTNYKSIVETSGYRDAVYSTPFTFLRVLYIAKRIDFYTMAEAGKKPTFEFGSIQEAFSTYNDIMNFKQIVEELLDKASIIVQADNIAEKLNNYVKLSDYLDDNLMIQRNTLVTPIAKECISVLPRATREISAELRFDLLKDMLNVFSEKQIGILAAKGVFKREDVDMLVRISVSDTAKKNIDVLCKGFGLLATPIKSVELNLKGVTFSNEDGSERQVYLKELDEYIKATGEHPALIIEPYTYQPELGEPEAAARVYWGEKCLGNLPREVASQVHEEYADKVMTASVINVVGGDSVAYGVKIALDVCEPILNNNSIEAERDIA